MVHKWFFILLMAAGFAATAGAEEQPAAAPDNGAIKEFVESHCLDCHDKAARKGGLVLDELLSQEIGRHSQAWEGVVRKLLS